MQMSSQNKSNVDSPKIGRKVASLKGLCIWFPVKRPQLTKAMNIVK